MSPSTKYRVKCKIIILITPLGGGRRHLPGVLSRRHSLPRPPVEQRIKKFQRIKIRKRKKNKQNIPVSKISHCIIILYIIYFLIGIKYVFTIHLLLCVYIGTTYDVLYTCLYINVYIQSSVPLYVYKNTPNMYTMNYSKGKIVIPVRTQNAFIL